MTELINIINFWEDRYEKHSSNPNKTKEEVEYLQQIDQFITELESIMVELTKEQLKDFKAELN